MTVSIFTIYNTLSFIRKIIIKKTKKTSLLKVYFI